MPTTIQERINQYLEDTIGVERNFEKALSTFGEAGVQTPVKALLSSASAKAKTQHERLEVLLKARRLSFRRQGNSCRYACIYLSFSSARSRSSGDEHTTSDGDFAAAAAEMAMYEPLATAGAEGEAEDVVSLARTLQGEERDDYDQVWSVLPDSAADSFRAELEKGTTAQDILVRYLEDAIAAEKSFETQLLGFSKEVGNPTVQALFREHAEETKEQYTLLTQRIEELGGSTSTLKLPCPCIQFCIEDCTDWS